MPVPRLPTAVQPSRSGDFPCHLFPSFASVKSSHVVCPLFGPRVMLCVHFWSNRVMLRVLFLARDLLVCLACSFKRQRFLLTFDGDTGLRRFPISSTFGTKSRMCSTGSQM